MHKHEHKQLLDAILRLDELPEDASEFSEWIQAKTHREFLANNLHHKEFLIYASGPYSFVNTILVPRTRVEPPHVSDLLNWYGCNPYTVRSSYVSGGARDGTWIEHGEWSPGAESLKGALQLIYIRTFEGWSGEDNTIYEPLQEFVHLQNIHWVSEQSAYCRLNKHGDLEAVLSISKNERKNNAVSLVSVERETLDEYLNVANLAAIRVFDFTLLRRGNFSGWGDREEADFSDGQGMWLRQGLMRGHAGFTRGFQIVQPIDLYATRRPNYQSNSDASETEFVKFTIYDWRNKRVVDVSTDPTETTSYFEAENNELPFDVSPAFFRPDVLLKYKADKDKYIIETRHLTCRGAWELRSFDVNEAGQLHAYICDLRNLPYSEKLHWAQFNERPRASISRRAWTTDFEGQFTDEIDPIDRLRSILEKWHDRGVAWWKKPDEEAMRRVCTPLTASRDEWAEAFLDLNKLVNEGFSLKAIRAELTRRGANFNKDERSLKLLERLWEAEDPAGSGALESLKAIAHIRSKTKGHAGATDSKSLAGEAIREFGSFRKHFDAICSSAVKELELIENLFDSSE